MSLDRKCAPPSTSSLCPKSPTIPYIRQTVSHKQAERHWRLAKGKQNILLVKVSFSNSTCGFMTQDRGEIALLRVENNIHAHGELPLGEKRERERLEQKSQISISGSLNLELVWKCGFRGRETETLPKASGNMRRGETRLAPTSGNPILHIPSFSHIILSDVFWGRSVRFSV